MWKCYKCNEIIDSLEYTAYTRGREWGSASLTDEKPEEGRNRNIISDWDYSDGETTDTDEYEYTCPECEDEIDYHQLIWADAEDIKEEEERKNQSEPEETKHKIITPKNNIISDKQAKDTTENAMICSNKKCRYVFVYQKENYDAKNEFCECPKCGTSNSISNYLKTFNNT